jgi:hypothetical protein
MEEDYYSSDFDPNSLTKQKLKSILSSEGIEFPGTDQRKSFYVDLFLQNIHGKKKSKIIPSTKGIIHVTKTGTPIKSSGESPISTPSSRVKLPRERKLSSTLRSPTWVDTGFDEIKASEKRSLSEDSPRSTKKKAKTPSPSPFREKSRTTSAAKRKTSSSKKRKDDSEAPTTMKESNEEILSITKPSLPKDTASLSPSLSEEQQRQLPLRPKHFVLTDDPHEPIKIVESYREIIQPKTKSMLEILPSPEQRKQPVQRSVSKSPPSTLRKPIVLLPKLRQRLFSKITMWILLSFLVLGLSVLIYNSMTRPFCDSVVSDRRKFHSYVFLGIYIYYAYF